MLHNFDPVLIKELEFYLNIRAKLLKLGLLGDETGLSLRELGHVGRRPGRHVLVVLQVGPVQSWSDKLTSFF